MGNPVHRHDLTIREKLDGAGQLECRGCLKEIQRGQIYYWCNLCSFYFHETCSELLVEIKHFFHPCPLFLYDTSSPGFPCNSCSSSRSNVFTYRCERCEFEMCVECASQALPVAICSGEREGEKILNCCHRHALQPLSLESSKSLLSCRVCNMPCSLEEGGGGPIWGCEKCYFHLHKCCLDRLPQTIQKPPPYQHYQWVLQTSPSKICSICNQTIHSNLVFRRAGWTKGEYLCISCCLVSNKIDESSSKISKDIHHFFHPCPYLKLVFSPSSTCNACFQSHHKFSYHCNTCDFFLCLDCAQLPQLHSHHHKKANPLVQHFSHWHPLKFFKGRQDSTNICSLCERFCSEPFYSCNDRCGFYIHKSCMDSLPHKINHRLLNQRLVVLTVPSFECTTCNMQRSGLTFYCSDRKYKFCVKCILWPENLLGNDARLKSIHHWHQLSLHETRIQDKKQTCFLCKESCNRWIWNYKCSECDLVFHKSCAELPAEIEHPIHPQHRLILTKRSSSDPMMTCKLCLKNLSRNFRLFDWVYQCRQCAFELDTQCATCLPSLEYEGHPHLLYVVVNMHGDMNCKACERSCKGSCVIRCADPECKLNLHLHCGPLPDMVKHDCHVHPLKLKDYHVEDNDSDEFACHICEEKRDPRLRVYCCSQGCLMISEIKCVLYEVLQFLRGERGEVELKTPFPPVASRVILNKSIFGQTNLDFIIKYDFSHKKILSSLKGQLRIEGEKDDEALEEINVNSYPFSWKALMCFLKLLRTPSIHIKELPFIRKYNGLITSGDYELPKILAPTYDEFFGTYNIVDHKCDLNFAEKRAMIFIACCFLHEMRTTKVVDVEKDTILVWLGLIRFVQEKGRFSVGFIIENIKHVWQAHYYIRSKKIVDDKSLELERELEQVSMHRAELRTKMDELVIQMEEVEGRYQKLKVEDKEHDTYRVVGSRGPMKKVRSNALEIKWRTCYESLVTFPGNAPSM